MTTDEVRLEDWIGRSRDGRATGSRRSGRGPCRRPWIACSRRSRAGDPLPPLWHWLFSLDRRAAHPGSAATVTRRWGGFLPPVGTPRRMWAGRRLHFPGSSGWARRRSDLDHPRRRREDGRTGPCVRHRAPRVCGARGLAIIDEHDIVYREDVGRGSRRARREPAPTVRRSGGSRPIRHAVPLFGADLQRPPHPLRPRLRDRRSRAMPGLRLFLGPLLATLMVGLAVRSSPERTVDLSSSAATGRPPTELPSPFAAHRRRPFSRYVGRRRRTDELAMRVRADFA